MCAASRSAAGSASSGATVSCSRPIAAALLGADRAPGEDQLLGARHADEWCESRGTDRDPESRACPRKLEVVARDAQIATGDDLGAAADAVADADGDRRNWKGPNVIETGSILHLHRRMIPASLMAGKQSTAADKSSDTSKGNGQPDAGRPRCSTERRRSGVPVQAGAYIRGHDRPTEACLQQTTCPYAAMPHSRARRARRRAPARMLVFAPRGRSRRRAPAAPVPPMRSDGVAALVPLPQSGAPTAALPRSRSLQAEASMNAGP
jgi:hypothetical protein